MRADEAGAYDGHYSANSLGLYCSRAGAGSPFTNRKRPMYVKVPGSNEGPSSGKRSELSF